MNKSVLTTVFATMLTASSIANAHCCNNGGGFGQAFGAAMAGATLGSLLVTAPQPTVVIVQQPIPLVPPPQPTFEEWRQMNGLPPLYQHVPYQSPQPGKQYWCGTSQRWYPDVQTCSIDWSLQHRIR